MKYENDVISERIKRRQKIKKISIIILYIILIPIMLFSLLLIILELGNSKEIPSFLNIENYTVTSESMEPRLKKNDVIVVRKGYSNDKFKVGNIITFKRDDGEIITHRIKKIILSDGQNAYITQGDNNEKEDEEIVTYDKIIGKVIYTVPDLGILSKLFKSKLFFIFCVLIFILIVMYDKNQKEKKLKRKAEREKYEKKSDFYF